MKTGILFLFSSLLALFQFQLTSTKIVTVLRRTLPSSGAVFEELLRRKRSLAVRNSSSARAADSPAAGTERAGGGARQSRRLCSSSSAVPVAPTAFLCLSVLVASVSRSCAASLHVSRFVPLASGGAQGVRTARVSVLGVGTRLSRGAQGHCEDLWLFPSDPRGCVRRGLGSSAVCVRRARGRQETISSSARRR